MTRFDIQKDGTAQVSPLRESNKKIRDLEEHLLTFCSRFSHGGERDLHDHKALCLSIGGTDHWNRAAMDAEAIVGKLVGAAGGGFPLCTEVRRATAAQGSEKFRFALDNNGSPVLDRK